MLIDSECIVTYKLFNGTPKVMSITTESNKLEIKLIDTFIPILKFKNDDCVTITIKNTSGADLYSIIIKDYLLPREKYISNSLTINGNKVQNSTPEKGIKIEKISTNDLLYISYRISNPNPQVTNCLVSYKYYNQGEPEQFSLINNQKTIHL